MWPEPDGVPVEPEFGFVAADRHGRVEGSDGVWAAGDAASLPLKPGGLAAQEAAAVAEHVAVGHGARLAPSPFRPVLRGPLFRGRPGAVRARRPARGGIRGRAGAVVAAD